MKTAQVALQFNIGDFDEPIESLLINSSPSHDLAPELVTQGYTAGMVNVGLLCLLFSSKVLNSWTLQVSCYANEEGFHETTFTTQNFSAKNCLFFFNFAWGKSTSLFTEIPTHRLNFKILIIISLFCDV